jgi:hypothetical protein
MPVIRREPISIERLADEYQKAKEFEDKAKAHTASLREALVAALQESGDPDDRGNLWIDGGRFRIKYERRLSTSLEVDKVEVWAKEQGLWDTITETVTVVDDGKLARLAFERPDLAPLLSEFYRQRESWALKVTEP